MSWRGTTLVIEPSKLYQGGVVLRHPGTLQTVGTKRSRREAVQWCRRWGYSWMNPVNVSLSALEERI